MTLPRPSLAPLAAAALLLPIALFAQDTTATVGSTETWLGLLGLGFLFGLKHALDADHLVAIGAIVGENRAVRGAALTGLWWGIGHTLSLLVAGVAVLVLRLQISERLESMLEMGVAMMIIILGGRVVWQLLRGEASIRFSRHRHGAIEHIHPEIYAAEPKSATSLDRGVTRPASGIRSLVIGVVHGLAGSAALMLLVLAQISSPELGLLYIVIFGLGSIIAMIAMSTLFWLPFLATTSRFRYLDIGLRAAAGLGSILFGMFMFLEHL